MLRNFGFAATLSLLALASPALAGNVYDGSVTPSDTTVVLITGAGYFPETVYTVPGAKIRFVNDGTSSETVAALSNGWSISALQVGEYEDIILTSGIELSYSSGQTDAFVGHISYDAPPSQ
jgi:plastocyanin